MVHLWCWNNIVCYPQRNNVKGVVSNFSKAWSFSITLFPEWQRTQNRWFTLKGYKHGDLSMMSAQRQKEKPRTVSVFWWTWNDEHVIPQVLQQSQLTALSLNNQKLKNPLVCTNIFQSQRCELCCDELFLTVNVCFQKVTRFLPGRKNPQRFYIKGQYVTSKFRKSLQSEHLSINWAHRYSPKATDEDGTMSWYNTVARDHEGFVVSSKHKGPEYSAWFSFHFLCKRTWT